MVPKKVIKKEKKFRKIIFSYLVSSREIQKKKSNIIIILYILKLFNPSIIKEIKLNKF